MLEKKRRDHDYIVRENNEYAKYGNMFIADVAGWSKDFPIEYPVITVEIMMSSDVRKEMENLSNPIFPTICRIVIDAKGEMQGIVNDIHIIKIDDFRKGFPNLARRIKEMTSQGLDIIELIRRGRNLFTHRLCRNPQ